MFEQVVATVLNRVLGAYVEGLETSQLNIGIWSGDVSLRKLTLRRDALDHLNLPIAVSSGTLGSLKMAIPWKNLKSAPIRVTIDNVHVVAMPKVMGHADPREETERMWKRKLEVLAQAEAVRASAAVSREASAATQDPGYMSQLITRLIDNLQISITNLHLTYADPAVSVAGWPFAIGATLSELSVVSADDQWREAFIDSASAASGGLPVAARKLLKLSNLSLFWEDARAEVSTDPAADRCYVLRPVSAVAKFTINREYGPNLPKYDIALTFAELALSLAEHQYRNLWLILHHFKVYDASFKYMHLRPPPGTAPTATTRWKFALNAVAQDVHEKLAPTTWQFLEQRRRDRKEYIRLVKLVKLARSSKAAASTAAAPTAASSGAATDAHGEGSGGKTAAPPSDGLAAEDRAKLDGFRRDLPLDDLMLFDRWALHELRQEAIAEKKLREQEAADRAAAAAAAPSSSSVPESRESSPSRPAPDATATTTTEKPATSEPAKGGWGSWLLGGWGGAAIPVQEQSATEQLAGAFPTDASQTNTIVDAETPVIELSDLKRFLDVDEEIVTDPDASMPPECLLFRVQFELKAGSCRIYRVDQQVAKGGITTDIQQQASAFSIVFEQSSAQVVSALDSSTSALLSMGSLKVMDGLSTRNSQPVVFAPQQTTDPSRPLFAMHVKSGSGDTAIRIETQSLVVVYLPATIRNIVDFVRVPDIMMDTYTAAAAAISNQTRAGLEYALETHQAASITMDVDAPVFLVPLGEAYQDAVLALDTGRLALQSKLPDPTEKSKVLHRAGSQLSDDEMHSLLALLVDSYEIELSEASLYLGASVDDCLTAGADTRDAIVDKISFEFLLERSIIPQATNTTTPINKIVAVMPSLQLMLSERKYRALMRAVDLLTEATSDADAAVDDDAVASGAALTTPPKKTDDDQKKHKSVEDKAGGGPDDAPGGRDMLDIDLRVGHFSATLLGPTTTASTTAPPDTEAAVAATAAKRTDENPIADFHLDGFKMRLRQRETGRNVGIQLQGIRAYDLQQPTDSRLRELVRSTPLGSPKSSTKTQQQTHELVQVSYRQTPAESNIDVTLADVSLVVTRKSFIDIYQMVMTTFVGDAGPQPPKELATLPAPPASAVGPLAAAFGLVSDGNTDSGGALASAAIGAAAAAASKMVVKLTLRGVHLDLNDHGIFANAHLGRSQINVTMLGETLVVDGTLGALEVWLPDGTRIAAIDSVRTATFTYEAQTRAVLAAGFDQRVEFMSESLRLQYRPHELMRILAFVSEFAAMRSMADSARQTAVATVGDARFGFNVGIKAPVLEYLDARGRRATVYLGVLEARNMPLESDKSLFALEASLRDMNVVTALGGPSAISPAGEQTLLDKVHILFSSVGSQMSVDVADVVTTLSRDQYLFLLDTYAEVMAFVGSQSSPADSALATPESSPQQQQQQQQEQQQTPSSGQQKSQRPGVSMELALTWSRLSLTLADLTQFDACNIFGHMMMYTAGGWLGEFGVERFGILDVRPKTKSRASTVARPFLSFAHETAGGQFGHQLLVNLAADPELTMQFTLDSPRFLFLPSVVQGIQAFFALPENKADHPSSPSAAVSSEPPTAEPEPTSPFSSGEGGGGARYQIKIVNAEVALADPEMKHALVIVLMHLQLVYEAAAICLNVRGLGAYLTRLDMDPATTPRIPQSRILQDVNISSAPQRGEAANVQSMMTDVQKVLLRMSYHEALFIQNLVTTFLQSLSLGGGDNDLEVDPVRSTELAAALEADLDASRASLPLRSSSASVANIPITSAAAVAAAAAQDARVIVRKQFMRLMVEGIRLILVDDLEDEVHVPMVDLSLDAFEVEVFDWDSAMRVTTTIPFKLNLWNPRNSSWEPIIEPAKLRANVSSAATTSVELSSLTDQVIDLNVTQHLVRTAMRTSAKWPTVTTILHPGVRKPFVIKNRTGHRLSVWNYADPNDDRVDLAAGTDIPWRFSDWKLGTDPNERLSQHRLALHYHGRHVWQTTDVATHRERQALIPLQPDVNGQIYTMHLGIAVENLRKVITIASPYKWVNMLEVDLEIACNDEVSVLRPQETYQVPLDAVFEARIRLRPAGGLGYGWSTAVAWTALRKTPECMLTCRSSVVDLHSSLVLNAEFDSFGLASNAFPCTTVSILAPILLENLLPLPVRFSVSARRNDSPIVSESLASGGIVSLASIDVMRPLGFGIEIPELGLRSQSYAVITALEELDDDVENEIVDCGPGQHINLRLRALVKGGLARRATIWSKFVLQNTLPLDLTLHGNGVIVVPGGRLGLTSSDRLALEVAGSEVSAQINFDKVGASTGIVLSNVDNTHSLHVGIATSTGDDPRLAVSKLVLFSARYIIRNELDVPLQFRQQGTNEVSACPAGGQSPVLWLHRSFRKHLAFRLTGSAFDWSTAASITDIGQSFLRMEPLQQQQQQQQQSDLIMTDTILHGATLLITVKRATAWPFRIENLTSAEIKFGQGGRSRRQYSVLAGHSANYAWDDPTAHDRGLQLMAGNDSRNINLFEIGALEPWDLEVNGRRRIFSIEIVVDGMTRVLRVSPFNARKSIYRQKERRSSAAEVHTRFEVAQINEVALFQLLLNVNLGLSLVDDKREVIYLSLRDLAIRVADTNLYQTLGVKLHWLQVDNQLSSALEPIAVFPADLTKDAKDQKVLELALVKSKAQSQYGITYIKYFTVLVQELSVTLDQDILGAVAGFFSVGEPASVQSSWQGRLVQATPRATESSDLVYLEAMHLGPLKLLLSFSMTDTSNMPGFLGFASQVISAGLANVHDFPLALNALTLEHPLGTMDALMSAISAHYYDQVMGKVYTVLGSADVLGNPVGLFTNLASGAKDIFYEPYQGIVSDRPQDLGIGLAKGTAAFFGKAVYGVADGFARFTDSVGKGLAVATFDSSYQRARQISRRRNRPKHAISGVTVGAKSLAKSVVSGVTGVVSQPLEGAQRSGVSGFLKGVALGGVGLFVKPIVGLADAASSVSQGIKNTTTVLDDVAEIDRIRLPRLLPDGVLTQFSDRLALGQNWLQTMDSGRHADEVYVLHFVTKREDFACIVSSKRFYMCRLQRLRTEWSFPLAEISRIDTRIVAAVTPGYVTVYSFAIHLTGGDVYEVDSSDPNSLDGFRRALVAYLKGGN
ncbi:hypothetical protein BC828DRAFT_404944 [Blastocladiella britannica]|nr:hypothetical protein BC828DRAFT_404944 [Blastocladiella britannica]